jgi:hypothetical protein
VPLHALPQLRNGKVDRQKLKQVAVRTLKEQEPEEPLPPGGDAHAKDGFALLLSALRSCSRMSSRPTRDSTFVELGLDSLDVMVLRKTLESEVRCARVEIGLRKAFTKSLSTCGLLLRRWRVF